MGKRIFLALLLWHSLYLPPLWAGTITKKFAQPFVVPYGDTATHQYSCPTIAGVAGIMQGGHASWKSLVTVKGVNILNEGAMGNGYQATLKNKSRPTQLAVKLYIHLRCSYRTTAKNVGMIRTYDAIDAELDAAIEEEDTWAD